VATAEDKLLKPSGVAELLGVPVNTLTMWRYRGVGPPWLKLGRHVRYRDRDLQRWFDEQTHGVSTDGPRLLPRRRQAG
jgi:DNA-binding transcriptional MerR regulator